MYRFGYVVRGFRKSARPRSGPAEASIGFLARGRVAQMRTEVEHNRLEARLAREARFAKASSLSEEARLAKARLGEGAVLRGGMPSRGTTFVAALFR